MGNMNSSILKNTQKSHISIYWSQWRNGSALDFYHYACLSCKVIQRLRVRAPPEMLFLLLECFFLVVWVHVKERWCCLAVFGVGSAQGFHF
jgi:hypothetical protein